MTKARRRVRGRRGKSIGAVAVIALAALSISAAPAFAHRVTSATPDCTSVHLVYESTHGTKFSGKVFVDNGTVAATWSHVAGVDIPTSGTLDVPYTHPAGAFSVYAQWWFSTGEANGLNRMSMTCSPASPSPATSPAPASPSATVTPTATPVAAPAPASDVAGVQARQAVRAAVAVAVAKSCASHTAQVTVRGRAMRDVALFVNGRHVRTISVAAGTTTVRAAVPIVRGRAQKVSARVRFRNGARPRTLVHSAVRCAAAAVQPQFTG
jgi:hypothetical protein